MEGVEAPVLPTGEEPIGRGPAVYAGDERDRRPHGVETLRMRADREVGVAPDCLARFVELLAGRPLGVEVVADQGRIGLAARSRALEAGSEPGVRHELGVLTPELLQRPPAVGQPTRRLCHRLEHPALQAGDLFVFDERRTAHGRHPVAEVRRANHVAGGLGGAELWQRHRVDEDLVVRQPADREVRARVRWLLQECGIQWQGAEERTAPGRNPFAQVPHVGVAPDAPVRRRAHRIERHEGAPQPCG
jgi:hypothetical protein